MLFDRSTAASFLGGAYVVDANGHVKASQNELSDRALSLARRATTSSCSSAIRARIEYFRQLVERIDAGRLGRVFIFLDDGTLLASKPAMWRAVGADYSDSPGFALMRSHPSGTFTVSTNADGVERRYTYMHVSSAPLIAWKR